VSNEQALSRLKENGFRITKQRKLIIDIILNNDGSSCKDICYQVMARDKTVGTATVYRMIRLLEDLEIVRHIDMISVVKQ
jgi:Fur family ferric uptake transcriptional regulator